jgi:hypothetical protein
MFANDAGKHVRMMYWLLGRTLEMTWKLAVAFPRLWMAAKVNGAERRKRSKKEK